MLWDKLSSSSENDYIDFKRQWYSGASAAFDLIHDILSMCNSLTDSIDRYIVIGVAEDKETKAKTIFDVASDENCRTAEDIIQILREYMPVAPNIEITRERIGDQNIDIIKITPSPRELPYTLRRSYYYQDEGKKRHEIPKDWIYSRDGSRNTGINEQCHKSVLEELFARKRGEHLPTHDRFAMFLDDYANWTRPKTSGIFAHDNLSEDAYYYNKNHKFKILRHNTLDEHHRKMQRKEDVQCYHWLVNDTGICEDYWEYRVNRKDCYDDYYDWFDIELWVDNTLIQALQIMELHFKYYFYDHGIHLPSTFYLPPRDYLSLKKLNTKEKVQNSFIWKICKMFTLQQYDPDIKFDDLDNLLDYINWEYLQDYTQYEKTHQDFLYANPDDNK